MVLSEILTFLWNDYSQINPQAGEIHALLNARGEKVINDHIAFRTFLHPRCGLNEMAKPFLNAGYTLGGHYVFEAKHLDAIHLDPPVSGLPKIFISGLRINEMPSGVQGIILGLINQIDNQDIQNPLCISGGIFKLRKCEYEALERESDYAAWLSAFGFRANHFTVSFNGLRTFKSLQDLNVLLIQKGFELNQMGGEIKGSRAELLEQSSTMAAMAAVNFIDGPLIIPGCYYEFALRHHGQDGKLFSGFLEKSADKIFESTHRTS